MNRNFTQMESSLEPIYKKEEARKNANSFECGVCSKMLKTEKLLVKHRATYALSRNKFECSMCAQTSFRERDIRRHFKQFHSGVHSGMPKSFKCVSITTSQKGKTVKRVMRACEYCDQFLSGTFNLNRHMKKCDKNSEFKKKKNDIIIDVC